MPSSVKDLIKECVLNVSGASEFYKKKAAVAALLHDFVEPLPNFHYRLKNQFDSYFLSSLSVFLRDDHREPADMLADALFYLGRQWARIDCGASPIASIPSEEFLRTTWKTAGDWESFLSRDGCIGEAWWHNLGADGKVGTWSGGSDPSDFELRIDFGWDTTKPPTMTIRVEGEPAVIFMGSWMTLNPNSPPQKHPCDLGRKHDENGA